MKEIFYRIKYLIKRRHFDASLVDIGSSSKLLPYGPRIRFAVSPERRIYVKVGDRCIINADVIFESIEGYIEIGNNVQIGSAKLISRKEIIIGNDVTMAWDITIYDHNSHSLDWNYRQHDNSRAYNDLMRTGNMITNKDWTDVISKPVYINDKVWIGFGVTILKGVTIGEGAVIGACSVVTKDVPPWTVVGGNPALVLKQIK